MTFTNPTNGYVKRIEAPGGLCLVGGPIFFALHGIWVHAILSAVLAVGTMGISWLLYPLSAESIVRNAYLSRGWKEQAEPERPPAPPLSPALAYWGTRILIVAMVFVALITAVDWYLNPAFYARVLGLSE